MKIISSILPSIQTRIPTVAQSNADAPVPSAECISGLKKAFSVLRLNYRALWTLRYPSAADEERDLRAIAALIAALPPDVIAEATRNLAMEIPSPPAVKTFAQYCFDVYEHRRQTPDTPVTGDGVDASAPLLPPMSFEDRRAALERLKQAVDYDRLRSATHAAPPVDLATPPTPYVAVSRVELFTNEGLQALVGQQEALDDVTVQIGQGDTLQDTYLFAFLLDVLRFSSQSGVVIQSRVRFELTDVLQWRGRQNTEAERAGLIATIEALARCKVVSRTGEHVLIENLTIVGSRVELRIGPRLWTLFDQLLSMDSFDSLSWVR